MSLRISSTRDAMSGRTLLLSHSGASASIEHPLASAELSSFLLPSLVPSSDSEDPSDLHHCKES